MKHKWKVGEAPTGRYRSFEKRSWPSAYYTDAQESVCAAIYCDTAYSPSAAKSGQHAELKVCVADHSQVPWKWRTLAQRFTSLEAAKAAVVAILEKHPHFIPKEK